MVFGNIGASSSSTYTMETKTPSSEYALFPTDGNGADEIKKEDVPASEPPTLSKNAARKLARYERVVAARKAKRREKKLARKRRLAAAKELECYCFKSMSEGQRQIPVGSVKEEALNLDSSTASGVPAPCICIDMGHTEHMSDKELNKLSSQLRRLYGSNRHSCTPLKLYFTHFPSSCRLYKMCVEKHQGFERYSVEMRAESHSQLFPKESLLYLSPDAPEALPSTPLESNTVYVIGGLVDETVHKNISLSSACAEGIQCAQLPIDEFMERCGGTGCKILTVNQVFDILLGVHETQGDWANSLAKVIPKRTGLRKKQSS
uniref:SAM-dependent MTase TRM10-type domain-containing protein n=1 Tax=Rhipicephalus pulchellus TaxID=72859 RepID=L7M188_RHIPC